MAGLEDLVIGLRVNFADGISQFKQLGDAMGGVGTQGSELSGLIASVATAFKSGELQGVAFEQELSKLIDQGGSYAQVMAEVKRQTEEVGTQVGTARDELGRFTQTATGAAESLLQVASATAQAAGATAQEGQAAQQAGSQLSLFDQWIKQIQEDMAAAAAAAGSSAAGFQGLGGAAAGATAPVKQFSDAAQAVVNKQQELTAAAENAKAVWLEMQAAYQRGAASAEDLARAEKELTSAMQAAGEASEQASSGAGDLLKQLLGFAGITIGLNALKGFAEDAVDVFAATEKATIALGYLTGSASQASETIERLKSTAVRLAVPFESLVKMQQDLTAAGAGIEAIGSAITAAADAAAARGIDFDKASSAIERIAETGNVSAKTLRSLAIDTKDMAQAMGVSVDQVKAAFAGLDVGDRLEVLSIALEKFKGAGEEVADSTAGNMQRMKVEWHLMLDDVGAAIAPFVNTVLPAISFAVKGIGTVITSLVSLVKELANIIVGSFSTIIEAAKTTGAVVADVFTGKFSKAIDDAKSGLLNLNAVSKKTWDSMVEDAKEGAAAIDKLWAAPSAEESPIPNKPKIKLPVDDSEATKALAAQEKAYESLAKTAQLTFNSIKGSYDEYIADLANGGKTADSVLSKLASEINEAETALPKLTGVAREETMRLIESLKSAQTEVKEFADTDALNKMALKVKEIADRFPEQIGRMTGATKSFLDSMLKIGAEAPAALSKASPVEILRLSLEAQKKLDEQTEHLNKTLDEGAEKAYKMGGGFAYTTTLGTHLVSQVEILPGIFDRIAQAGNKGFADVANALRGVGLELDGGKAKLEAQIADADILFVQQKDNLPLIEALWQKYGNAIEKAAAQGIPTAIKAFNDYRETITHLQGPMGQAIADEAELAKQIQEGVAAGKDVGNLVYEYERLGLKITEATEKSKQMSQGQILSLYQQKLAIDLNRDSVNLLSDQYVKLSTNVIKAFEDLGRSVADSIVDGKNWGEIWKNAVKGLAKSILEDLVGGAFKLLGQAVMKATGDALGLDKLFKQVATTGAQTASSLGGASTSIAGSATKVANSAAGIATSAAQMVSTVANVVGAVAGIASFITSLETNHKLSVIEYNTRISAIYLGQQSGNIMQSTMKIAEQIQYAVIDLDSIGLSMLRMLDLLGTLIGAMAGTMVGIAAAASGKSGAYEITANTSGAGMIEALHSIDSKTARIMVDIHELGPALSAAISASTNVLAGQIHDASENNAPLWQKMLAHLGGINSGIGGVISGLGNIASGLSGAVGGVVGGLIQGIGSLFHNDHSFDIAQATADTFREVSNLRKDSWDQYGGIFDRMGEMWTSLQDVGTSLGHIEEALGNIFDRLGEILTALQEGAVAGGEHVTAPTRSGGATTGSGSSSSTNNVNVVVNPPSSEVAKTGDILGIMRQAWADDTRVLAVAITALGASVEEVATAVGNVGLGQQFMMTALKELLPQGSTSIGWMNRAIEAMGNMWGDMQKTGGNAQWAASILKGMLDTQEATVAQTGTQRQTNAALQGINLQLGQGNTTAGATEANTGMMVDVGNEQLDQLSDLSEISMTMMGQQAAEGVEVGGFLGTVATNTGGMLAATQKAAEDTEMATRYMSIVSQNTADAAAGSAAVVATANAIAEQLGIIHMSIQQQSATTGEIATGTEQLNTTSGEIADGTQQLNSTATDISGDTATIAEQLDKILKKVEFGDRLWYLDKLPPIETHLADLVASSQTFEAGTVKAFTDILATLAQIEANTAKTVALLGYLGSLGSLPSLGGALAATPVPPGAGGLAGSGGQSGNPIPPLGNPIPPLGAAQIDAMRAQIYASIFRNGAPPLSMSAITGSMQGANSLSSPASLPVPSVSATTIGNVTINVNGAQGPQQTVREIFRAMRNLSPQFSEAALMR
jgi:hypothetical protein